MGAEFVGSTSRNGLSVEQVGGNDVYQMLPQLQSVLDGLGPQYKKLFAEPVDNGRDIDWYADSGGKIIPLSKLPMEERQNILIDLKGMLEALNQYASRLRASDKGASRNYADYLVKAMTLPGHNRLSYIYSVDGKPLLTGWGFSDGSTDIVDGVRDLIKEVGDSIKDNAGALAEKAVETAKKAAPEAAAPAAASEPAAKPEAPAPQPEAAPQAGSPSQPMPPPSAPSSMGWLVAVLVGAALVLAGAAAAWYFLYYKPNHDNPLPAARAQDLGFLKGNLYARGVLINQDNEKVDLELHFAGSDGKGDVTISEKDQVCRGATTASAEGSRVLFDIPAIHCPNGNNYEPMLLDCERGSDSCIATYEDGTKFNLNLNK